jgi:hypothetical protein
VILWFAYAESRIDSLSRRVVSCLPSHKSRPNIVVVPSPIMLWSIGVPQLLVPLLLVYSKAYWLPTHNTLLLQYNNTSTTYLLPSLDAFLDSACMTAGRMNLPFQFSKGRTVVLALRTSCFE